MTVPEPNASSELPTTTGTVLRKLVIVGAGVGLLLLFGSSDWLQGLFGRLLAVTEQTIAVHPVAGALLFVLLAALSGMLAFFSSALIAPVAVHTWGPTSSALLLWGGWILGGTVSYAIGRFLGRPLFGRVTPKGLAQYERLIRRDTPFGLVAMFQLAMPSEVPGYFLGVVRYSFWRYIVVVAAGELPYAIGTVILGHSFLTHQVLPFVLLGGLAVASSVWAAVRLRRGLHASATATAPAPS